MRRLAMRLGLLPLLAAAAVAGPAHAQSVDPASPCERADLPAGARQPCLAAAQAAVSVQPQLGILLAGGNPTLGSTSTAGLRVPGSPGVAATGRLNVVPIRIPDLLGEDGNAGAGAEQSIWAPALSGTLSINVTRGTDLAPTVGGIGAVDLLGSVTWIPLRALDLSSFRLESSEFSYGVGARIGLLRESFTLPGASVSVMYRRLSEVGYGSACRSPIGGTTDSGAGYRYTSGVCAGGGDPGELVLDLTDISARGVVGKQIGPLGLAAGAGWDRFDSDLSYGFRAAPGSAAGSAGYIGRVAGLEVEDDRLSAFGNVTLTALVTTFSLELGWMEGGEAVRGYPTDGDFDPARGILFGGLGIRLSY